MIELAIVFIGSSLLMIALAIPLALGKVKPNWVYGFRTPRTINNPDIWYPVNSYAGKALIYAGIVILTVSLALLPLRASAETYALTVTAVVVVALGAAIGMSFRYLGQLWKARQG
jgi:uncharacterized membrane protein